jgi:hypothetical protein
MRGGGDWTRVPGALDRLFQVPRHQFLFTAPLSRRRRVVLARTVEGRL